MQTDELKITILPDGRIRVETDEIGSANHLSAEQLEAYLGRMAGGEVVTVKKNPSHTHTHQHLKH